jgi:C4-dicarboxylate transporter, DctM subunit
MSAVVLGGGAFGILLALMALRVPVGAAMLFTGMAAYAVHLGPGTLLNFMKGAVDSSFSVYELSIIPMFILMGQFAARGGLSGALFHAANAVLGRFRGGVAMAAIGASAGFGAICGSSLATAATMARVSLPELERLRYAPRFATGALAAGGTLGILIPPSIPLVVYAILTEQNIAKLFLAAAIPGLLAMLGYMVVALVYGYLRPADAPPGRRFPRREVLTAVWQVWPVVTIFVLVIGGIYGGVFTPTEAAAIGAVGTGLVARLKGGLSLSDFHDCALRTAQTTAMIFFIVLGGAVFSVFLAASGFPTYLATSLVGSGLSPLLVLLLIILAYIALGCVMDSMSMIILTVPVFFPVVVAFDFWGLTYTDKALWFGVLTLTVIEIGQITPPVGMNVYIIKGEAPRIPIEEIFKGTLLFLASDVVRIALLVAFPAITLWLIGK